jgi:ribose transport system permease protein
MLATGAAVGFVNGAIFIFGRIPNPFIVTLAMLYLIAGLALVISKGETLPGMPDAVQSLGNDDVLVVPAPVLLVAGLAVLISGLTRRTKLGKWIYAVGGNTEAAARVGIPVGGVQIATYVLSGVCAAVAAVVIAGRTNSGYPTAGEGLELDVIAAVIVGGTSIFGGRGNVGGVVIGALLLGVIRNGLNLLDVSPFWQLVVIGAIILAAVALDVLRTRLEVRFQLLQARRLEA